MMFGRKKPATGRPSPFVLAIAGVILVTAAVLRIGGYIDAREPTRAEVVIGDSRYEVEVADTVAKRTLGLGKRDDLPVDQGMYFPMGAPQYWTFWMKDVRFAIDIVWIREGRVVDITPDVPPPGPDGRLPTYAPSVPADAVLELAAGEAARGGILPGDEVRLIPQ